MNKDDNIHKYMESRKLKKEIAKKKINQVGLKKHENIQQF